jgi:hypothetical protein
MIAFFSVSPHSKKGLKITDLLKFDWENKKEKFTDADFERVKNRFKNLKKWD